MHPQAFILVEYTQDKPKNISNVILLVFQQKNQDARQKIYERIMERSHLAHSSPISMMQADPSLSEEDKGILLPARIFLTS